jgi:hypothetical protein
MSACWAMKMFSCKKKVLFSFTKTCNPPLYMLKFLYRESSDSPFFQDFWVSVSFWYKMYLYILIIIPPQTKFGGYIGLSLSVCPSYLVSATPPKLLGGM